VSGASAGGEGLAMVKGLGGNLAGMVHAHEGGRMTPLRLGKLIRLRASGQWARALRRREHGAQAAIKHADEGVQQTLRLHMPHYTRPREAVWRGFAMPGAL
jgi:hypothetical protein